MAAGAGCFIECVREHPALWDKSLKEYSDNQLTENIWIDIEKDLGLEGEYINQFSSNNIGYY